MRTNDYPIQLGAVVFLAQIGMGAILFAGFQQYVPTHLHTGPGFPGYLLAAYGAGRFVFEGAAGAISDRIERKRGLLAGFGLMLPVMLAMAVVRQQALYLSLALVLGLGTAFLWPIVYAIGADLQRNESRGLMVAFLNLAQVLGFGLGALAGAGLVTVAPEGIFGLAALGIVAAISVTLFSIPAYRRDMAPAASRRPSLRTALSPEIAGFSLVVVLSSLGLSLILPAIRPFGVEELDVSFLALTIGLVPGALTAAALFIPAGRASDRFGRATMFLLGQALIVGGLLALSGTSVFAVACVAAALVMGGNVIAVPAWNALIMDMAPASHRGTIIGLSVSLNGLGLAAGSAIGGLLVAAYGARVVFASAAVLASLSAAAITVHRLRFRDAHARG